MKITADQFKKAVPMCAEPKHWAELLSRTMIVDREEYIQFLAQCAHESQGFTRMEENLNYSAERLRKVWPKRFPERTANLYAGQPIAIANYVYANRNGNGPEMSGDGWMYRGSGPLMLTGRANFRSVGYEDTPNVVRTSDGGLDAALAWWFSRPLLRRAAQQGRTDQVREIVNGPAMLGLDETRGWVIRFARALA